VTSLAWLVPFFPLLGALIVAAGGRWLKGHAHIPVITGIALAFLVALGLLFAPTATKAVDVPWLNVTDLDIHFVLRVDGLTTMMLTMVTFVSTLIAIFSAGYMAGDPGYPRFFAFIGLFVFSMTGLVLSSNYVLTYVFWEGVGVCSYILIGFWYTRPAAAAAAKKAFLVNRVGDFGFAVALFWLWSIMPGHSLNYNDVLNRAMIASFPAVAQVGIPLLLFWAATAKSAQIPLYVWLPDAMEGPTPVSALIHAATMVTAGVYLIARSSLLLLDVPGVRLLIAIIGGATALLSAAIALTQMDLKRVLAYSTVSQLGYMFMGLGTGIGDLAGFAVIASMFHLFTHAFFKALLFLGAGSVMHSMGGVIDMRRFGGLRQRLPVTCWTFAVGGLALAGLPPLAGFFSKDEILAGLRAAAGEAGAIGHSAWGGIYWIIWASALFTAFLTAFYTGRAFFLTFFGPERLPNSEEAESEPGDPHGLHPDNGDHTDVHLGHESPPVMTYPLIILAACAVLVGMVYGPTGWFAGHLARTPGFEELGYAEHGFDWITAILGTLVGVSGLALSWFFYGEPNPIPAKLARSLPLLYRASYNKFYVDELYDAIIIGPIRTLAVISRFFDEYIIDGLVNLVAWFPRMVGRDALAPFQNGLIQFYAAVTALGVAVLLVVLLMT
jgi:NADH-quinone oxidoreductase subunit L